MMDVRNTRFSPEPEVPAGGVPPVVDKVFKQEDVDNIVTSRLAKEQVKHQKELETLYSKIGVKSVDEIDVVIDRAKKYDTVSQELETLKTEKQTRQYTDTLKDLDVDADFVEFVFGKVEKGTTIEEFKANAATYLKEHPKYLKESYSERNSGLNLNGGAQKKIEEMTESEYIEFRRTHAIDGSTIKKK